MRHLTTTAFAIIFAASPATQLAADTELPDAVERMPGSDLWIQSRLITAYSLNEHLNPFDIQVESENGIVTLEGQVPSEVQHDLALHLARDLGSVRQVKDKLEVSPTQSENEENPLYRTIEDANITTRVQLQLLWNSQTGGLDIDANTSNGTVTLSGTAGNAAERRTAERIALNTQGVRGVENRIEIKPKASPSDQPSRLLSQGLDQITDGWITTRVIASLRFDSAIKDSDIDVNTSDGVVSLTGQVRDAKQKKLAGSKARSIYGVTKVNNELEIEGSA
ncbi:BON domain-containing protein [Halochromatium sp.]